MGVKLKTVSGEDVVAIFERFGFVVIGVTGAHAKLRRVGAYSVETLVVPLHAVLPKGTLKAIFNQGARYVPSEQLHSHFYTADR